MHEEKKARLEAKGWRVGSATEFLGLSASEEAYIEIRLSLASALKRQRARKGVTQEDLARAVASSQSRIAKMEAGDTSVSLDLLIRTLLALGTSKRSLASIISCKTTPRAV
jgi:ribosome-binding protein aMBF1 (putative translation factor)